MRLRIQVALLFITLSLVAACTSETATPTIEGGTDSEAVTGTYQTLAIDEFATILNENAEAYTIINVHLPYAGEIEGTDTNIAFNDIDALMEALPDINAPVILYCRSGNMSEQATQALLAEGYTQVWDVPGGMNAWQTNGGDIIER